MTSAREDVIEAMAAAQRFASGITGPEWDSPYLPESSRKLYLEQAEFALDAALVSGAVVLRDQLVQVGQGGPCRKPDTSYQWALSAHRKLFHDWVPVFILREESS